MNTNSGSAAGAPGDLAARAAERMLGPNPFVGLRAQRHSRRRPADRRKAMHSPALLLEQDGGARPRSDRRCSIGNSNSRRSKATNASPIRPGANRCTASPCRAILRGAMRSPASCERIRARRRRARNARSSSCRSSPMRSRRRTRCSAIPRALRRLVETGGASSCRPAEHADR